MIGTIRFTRPISRLSPLDPSFLLPFILLRLIVSSRFSDIIISGISILSRKKERKRKRKSVSFKLFLKLSRYQDIYISFLDDRGPEKVPPLESKRKEGGWWREGWIFGGPPEEADGHETGVIGEPSRLLPRPPLSPRYRFQDPRIGRFLRYLESRWREPRVVPRMPLVGDACLDRLVTHLLSPSSLGVVCKMNGIDRIDGI